MADLLTNGLVQSYRQFLLEQGKVDDRPDIELTVDLGRILKDEGVFDSQAAQHPDFKEQFYLATQNVDRSVLGEVGAGIRRGARGLGATAMGAAALGLDVVGADKYARDLALKAREFAKGGYDSQATVGGSDEVVDTTGGVRYGLGKIGEAAPSIAEALITAVIGAGAGTASAPGPGTVAGGIAGFVGKSAIKRMIQKGVTRQLLGRELGEEAVEAALTNTANTALRKAFVDESRAIAARMGAGTLGAINSLGLSSGEIYNETEDVGASLAGGAIAAIPDTILPTYIIGKFFPGAAPAAARSFVKRLGVEASKTIPIEAGTEAFQELVNIAAAKYSRGEPPTLNDADYKRLREAAIGGAAGGVLGAPLAAGPSGRAPTPVGEESLTEDPALAARRAAATGVPVVPPAVVTPVSPPAPTPGQILAKVVAMAPEDQDARLKVLLEAASLSPIEQQELVVLRAKVSQRPGTSAPVVEAPPLAPTAVTPAAGTTAAAAVPAPSGALLTDDEVAKTRSNLPSLTEEYIREAIAQDVQTLNARHQAAMDELDAIQQTPGVTVSDPARVAAMERMSLLQNLTLRASDRDIAARKARLVELGYSDEQIANSTQDQQREVISKHDKLTTDLSGLKASTDAMKTATRTPVPLVALPPEPTPKPAPVPFTFAYVDPNYPPGKGDMFNLGEDIMDPTTPGRVLHPKGSSVNRATLEGYGFTVPPAPKPAGEAAPSTKNRLNDLIARGLQRHVDEQRGQAVLDEMEAAGKTPMQTVEEFWRDTYPILPEEQKVKFERYIQRETSLKPGDVVSWNPDTQERVVAKDWSEIYPASQSSNTVEHLEGTERGLIALMETANQLRKTHAAETVPARASLAPPQAALPSGETLMARDRAAAGKPTTHRTWKEYDAFVRELSDAALLSTLKEQGFNEASRQQDLFGATLDDRSRQGIRINIATVYAEALRRGLVRDAKLLNDYLGIGQPGETQVQIPVPAAPAPLPFGRIAKIFGPNDTVKQRVQKGDKTNVAIVLRDDTNTSIAEEARPVFFQGEFEYKANQPLAKAGNIKEVGKAYGVAVQNMAALRKVAGVSQKIIQPGGHEAALLSDLGGKFTPIMRIVFDGGAQRIGQVFPNLAAFTAAVKLTEQAPAAPIEAPKKETGGGHAGTIGGDAGLAEADKVAAPLPEVLAMREPAEPAWSKVAESTALPGVHKISDAKLVGLHSALKRVGGVTVEKLSDLNGMERESMGEIAKKTGLAPRDFLDRVGAALVRAKNGAHFADILKGRASRLDPAEKVIYNIFPAQPHPLDPAKTIPGYVQIERAEDARGQPFTDAERAKYPKPPASLPKGTYTIEQIYGAIAMEQGVDQMAYQAAPQFAAMVDRLRRQGFDIELLQRELGEIAQNAYTHGTRVVLTMADIANANMTNLVSLIHEVGHVEVFRLSGGMQARLSAAVDRTFGEVTDGKFIKAALNANQNWEEKLVEKFAIKLTEEGFGAESATLAQAIWRTVKELYYRLAFAMARALGVDVSDATVTGWFENNLRRRLGGDFDWRFIDLFSPYLEKAADMVGRFQIIDGQTIPDLYDPVTHSIRRPLVLPDSPEAAEWNIKWRYDPEPDLGKELNMLEPEAMARVEAAALNHLMPTLRKLQEESPKAQMKKYWDAPKDRLDKLETRFPGAGTAKIGGEKMTGSMNELAEQIVMHLLRHTTSRTRTKAMRDGELIEEHGTKVARVSDLFNKTGRDFMNGAVMDDAFNEELRELAKDLASGMSQGADTAFAAGTLHGAIRELEKLTPEQAIPADYQNAFKRILDKGGVPVIEHMKAIAKLNLDLANMKVSDVIAAIQKNAEGDPALASLVTQRPLMVALASLARNSSRSMDLLLFRATAADAKYAEVKAELDEIRTANDTRLDEIELGIKAVRESGALQDRLRRAFFKAKRDLQSAERALTDAAERKLQREHFANVTEKAAADLEPSVGAFSTWEAYDGAKYVAMQLGTDGKWTRAERLDREGVRGDPELVMIGEAVTAQAEQVARDLQMNRLWLEQQVDQETGKPIKSRLYNEVKKQFDQLSNLNFGKKRQAASRIWLEHYIKPQGEIFGGMGDINGTKLQQMLNQFASIMFVHQGAVEEGGDKWDRTTQEAAKAANYPNPKRFFQEVGHHVFGAIESEPGLGETAALKLAQQVARRRLKMNNFEPGPDFPAKLERFVRRHYAQSGSMLALGEKQGIYIQDAVIKDPLVEKSFLMRHAIKHNDLGTASRRLNMPMIQTFKTDLELAGWHDKVFADPEPTPDAEVKEVKFHETVTDWPGLIAKYFTPNIVKILVEPFALKSGKGPFSGVGLTQLQAHDLWEKSGGDVLTFIDGAFDLTNTADTRDGLNEYRVKMLRTFRNLYIMGSKIAHKTDHVPGHNEPAGIKPHRMMDARTNELIPPEWYVYDMFTPLDSYGHLAEIAYHSAFGRDGKGLKEALQNLEDELKRRSRNYDNTPTGTNKQMQEYAAQQAAAGRPGWGDFKAMKRAAKDLKVLQHYKAILLEHFSTRASLGDASASLEVVRTIMGLMLNQPKSALWNLPATILEHPLVYRGLGPTSLKATGRAVNEFVHGLFKSMLNQGGAEMIRAADHGIEVGDYASVISPVVERRLATSLDYKTFISDMGPAGEYSSGELAGKFKRGAHIVQKIQRKSFGKGGFNPVGVFTWMGGKADSALGISNARAFETIVSRVADYFAAHPEDAKNPTFKLTADNLGMKNNWWFSDEGAFEYFRAKAEEYRLGNLEQIGRDSLARRKKGQGLLTKDQVLAAAHMSLQEISLVSGINTRPIGMLQNGLPGLASLLLGWPVAQINKINNAFRTPDGTLTVRSSLTALGVLAAWTLPVGLAYGFFVMDEYDEELLNKKSNMRSINVVDTLPIIGIPIAIARGEGLAVAERLGRAGTYGLAGDFINSVLNWTDPTTGQRDFDLNSRILVFSMYATMRDTFRNFWHSGREVTYDSTVRPILMSMGGGGALQAIQVVNNALGLENVESAATNRINVMSWLRAGGRDAGLELRAGGGRSSPTPLSVQLNLMKTAALSNDRARFAEAYRAAVEIARQDPDETDPENKVLQGYKSRHPLLSAFVGKPTEADMNRLMGSMNENGQRAIREAVTLYSQFEEMIAPNPFVRRMELQQRQQMRAAQPVTIEQLRRRAAMGY